jgi:hypothetical protein
MSSATAALSRRTWAPRRRFSSTLSAVKVPRPSGTWATPMRTTSSVLRPVTSWPSMRTLPVVRTIWQMARKRGRLAGTVGAQDGSDAALARA